MPDPREQAEAVARWCGFYPCNQPRICDGSCIPNYAEDLNAMADVEREIERRGLEREYVCAVAAIAKIDASRMFPWLRVTALQRLAAAYRTIQEGKGA